MENHTKEDIVDRPHFVLYIVKDASLLTFLSADYMILQMTLFLYLRLLKQIDEFEL